MRLLVAGAVATVVVGFVIGFALGGRGDDGGDSLTAAAPSTTATSAPTSTTEGSTTTEAPASTTTTATPRSTATTAVATTEAPTTTEVVPFPTIPPTLAPTTAAPPTYAPPRVVVSYATDGSGRLIIPRAGTANLVITNEGGVPQQWLVTGTGFGTVGATQGSLSPGQTVTVTLVAPPGELPTGEIPGIISVLGAVNPTVAFVIPPA